MIPVPNNTFFIKTVPPSGSILPLISELPDTAAKADSELLSYSSGDKNVSFVVSGNTNLPFTNGQYDVVGGYLRTYASGADVSTTGQPAELAMYVFKDDYEIKEGEMSLMSNTNDSPTEVIYSQTFPEGGIVYAHEEFTDEGDLNFEPSTLQGHIGHMPFLWYADAIQMYASKNTYTVAQAEKILKRYVTYRAEDMPGGSNAGGVRMSSVNVSTGKRIGTDGQEYVDGWGSNSIFTNKGTTIHGRDSRKYGRIYLTKEKRWPDSNLGNLLGNSNKMWKATTLKDNNTLNVHSKIKFWDWSGQVSKYIQYDTLIPLPSGDDNEVRQTTNNTIFNSLFSSRLVHNPWNADATNPLLYSLINISKTEGQAQGNAARFYHSWDYASGSAVDNGGKTAIEVQYGRSADVNGQMIRAGIFNIPMPITTDVGHDKAPLHAGGTFSVWDRRTYFPEVSMDMRIDKMGATPLYGMASHPTKYTKSTLISGETAGTNEAMIYSKADGATVAARAAACVVTGTDYANDKLESLLRGVFITFSNYLPSDVDSTRSNITLDEFLNHGLNNFYINQQTKEGIVGGLMLRTYGMTYNDTGAVDVANTGVQWPDLGTNDIFAQAIPVMANYDLSGASKAVGSGKLYENGGIMRLSTGYYDDGTDGRNGGIGSDTGDNYLLRLGIDSWVDSFGAGDDWAKPPFWAALPFNSFFKLRFFWDIYKSNSERTASRTPYSDLNESSSTALTNSQGPILRVIFETEDGANKADTSKTVEHQFVDIPFPCNLNDSMADTTGYWSPLDTETGELDAAISNGSKLWPRHMIIWVNNYRYIVGSSNSKRKGVIAEGMDDDYYYYGDIEPEGSTKETEVFIDNIMMKNFMPQIDNHTYTNAELDPLIFKSNTVDAPLYNIIGSGTNDQGQRRLISFNANWSANQAAANVASYTTMYPSQALVFGWDSKADLPTTGTSVSSGYCLLNGFSTMNFPQLNRFNYPFWTYFTEGGFISMASNVVTNDVDVLGHQYMGPSFISGTQTMQTGSIDSSANLSGSAFTVTDTSTIADNKLTIASGANTFRSADAFTQKGFIYLNVSGNAGDDTTVDWGNWGKREHAGVSVKVIEVSRGENGLNNNQLLVNNNEIFNQHQNDEYILYRAHSSNTTATRLTGLRLEQKGPLTDNIITFNKDINFADDGTSNITNPDYLSELYISPLKYWVTMTYPTEGLYGSSNNENLLPRSYESLGFLSGTPTITGTGTTLHESIYSYVSGNTGVGRAALSDKVWDLELDDMNTVLELTQDWGYGAWDQDAGTGGQVAQPTVLSGTYVDFDLGGAIGTSTIKGNTDFLLYSRLTDYISDSGVDLYSPASSDTTRVPRFYWMFSDFPPDKPTINVAPAVDLLSPDINLYELTTEDLNAVKYTWSERTEDIWYRYMIMSTGSISNKYEGARLWIPLNEQPNNQNLKEYTTPHYVYDVVSGTSTTLTNAAGVEEQPLGITAANGYSSLLTSDLTGIAGWAPVFSSDTSGQYATLASGGNFDFPFQNAAETEKFSIMAHVTPTSGTSQAYQFILSKGVDSMPGSTDTGISVALSGATPYVQVCHAGEFITAATPITNDGSAVNIIYTYNSGSATGPDAKLYVNGVLEGYKETMPALPTTDVDMFIGTARDPTSTAIWTYSSNGAADGSRTPDTYDGGGSGVTPTSTDGSGVIGTTKFKIVVASDGFPTFTLLSGGSGYAAGDTLTFADAKMGSGGGASVVLTVSAIGMPKQDRSFNGHIEEIVFYNHELQVPENPDEFIYNTANDLDLSGNDLVTHNARLFLCDYHNIRGKSPKTQTISNQVTWRATV